MKKILFSLLSLSTLLVKAQSGCSGLNAGPDVSICIGGSIQLGASGGFNYSWSPSASLNNSFIYNPVASPATTTTYTVTALVANPDSNLVVNGDFEQGNTGFSSSYTYASNMFPTSTYNVGSNPNTYNGNFSACGDHTSGSGNMMIMNGSTNANTNVWCQTVAVTPGSDYVFSMWVCKLFSSNPAQFQLSINGQTMFSTYTITTGNCVWSQFSFLWNAGPNTSASICITDINLSGGGNDFAIDDITFSPVCTSTDSVTVTVQPNNIVANAGPDTTICEGGTATLTASGGSIYQWSHGAGSTASVNVSPTSSSTYTVTVSSPGCSGATDEVTVFVIPNPAPVISQSGDSLFCSTNAAYTSYQWYFNNTLIPGATDTIYVITQSGSYSVKVTNSNGCERTVTKAASLVVPTAGLSVNGPTCTNACFSFNNLSINATSYKWQFPGATPTSSSQVHPQNICYANPGTYTVVLTAYNTGTQNIKTMNVVVYAPPPIPVVTQSNDTLYCSTHAAYISYQWYFNNTLIPGATNTYIKVTQNGNYSVVVTDIHGCSRTVVKTAGLVLPDANFTSATQICQSGCIDFTNLSQNATSYKWLFPGATPSSDTVANPQNICYGTAGNYNVVLIAFNGGNSDTATFTNYITIHSPPPAPVITQTGATLYSSTHPSYSLYQWYNNNSLIPGAVDTSLLISQSGTYKVQVTDANGCTNTGTISAVLLPPAAGFSASTNICANTCIDFTNLSVNAESYQWFFPGAFPATDTTENPQGVCYTTGGSYDVILIATGSGGKDTLQMTGYINVYEAPPTPIITLQGTTLYCSTDPTYYSYQWYANAVLIPNATDTSLSISQSGNYNVQVTDENNCTIAVGINVVLTGIGQYYVSNSPLSLYPNPANDRFMVYSLQFTVAQLNILNILGEIVQSKTATFIAGHSESIDLSRLTSGIYFLQLSTEQGKWTSKFVKE